MLTGIPDIIDMVKLVSVHTLGIEWKTQVGSGELLEQLQGMFTALHQPGRLLLFSVLFLSVNI